MYAPCIARTQPDDPAIIMASSGQIMTHAELERRSNQLAHYLRSVGLGRLDHYTIFMENNTEYITCCAAGERAGLYYTCAGSHLTHDELGYILVNSKSKLLITSEAKRETALKAMAQAPGIERCLVVDGPGDATASINLNVAVGELPGTPIEDESLGTAMLYSSGTTGRPKGVLRPLPEIAPGELLPLFGFLDRLWRYRDGMVFLSPAPLYHAAPQISVNLVLRRGGTVVIMEHFDPEQFLALVERYEITHSQLVPTMFSRMLKLPQKLRENYELSSLEVAIHAAAPCPPQVKEAMIAWWGPIIYEYYGATEGMGFAACDTAEWLAHRGTVGRVLAGNLHVLDDRMRPTPAGTPGTLWFDSANPFEYFQDPESTAATRSPDGRLVTVGDVGYVDDDGFLYLTDRATFLIISGGVNIYPQECENLLIVHPKVADAAVFGVPNEDLGEEVKAVIQPMPNVTAGPELAGELIAYCRERLSRVKCPNSIDFEDQLPRLATGKLFKRLLRDRYWKGRDSRIV